MPARKRTTRRKAPAKRAGAELPPEPWERQDGESDKAFQAFATYRDLGPDRTVRKVAQNLNKAGSLIGEWSSKHRWVQRAAAWDQELDRIRQAELQEEAVDAARRHAAIVQGHLQAGALITQKFLELLAAGDDKAKGVFEQLAEKDPAALAELMIRAARVAPRLVVAERLSLGISTSNAGGHDGGPLADDKAAAARAEAAARVRGMTDEQLAETLLGAGVVDLEAERQKRARGA